MPSSPALRFEWVSDVPSFLELRDQWNSLGSSAIETVFLAHDWLATWIAELAPDADLHVLTAWDADRLVAALPLFGCRMNGRGRRWAIMGTGILTPNHLDIIAEKNVGARARDGFVAMLLEASANWDVLELDKLPADTETAGALRAAFGNAGLATSCSVSAICPHADLPPTYDEYLAGRGHDHRKSIRRKTKRLSQRPEGCRFALMETAAEALEALAALRGYHQARFEAMGYPGALADPRVVRFHDAVVPRLLAAGHLRLYTLTLGDQIIAVSYSCRMGATVEAYLASFDDTWAFYSPGLLVQLYALEQSILEGATRFDFLEGTEAYKSGWCTGERANLRLSVYGSTIRGQSARARRAAGQAIIHTARKVVPQPLRESVVKILAHRNARRGTP